MKRRLYFLFPEVGHARRAVDELSANGVDARQMHALARPDIDLGGLPPATEHQRHDALRRLERGLWNGNLALFVAALLGLLMAVGFQSTIGTVLALMVMAATVASGAWFALRLPSVHLDEFRAALEHGEILLMVDVSRDCVESIEELMLRVHPEAVPGGSSWTPNAFGV